MLEYTKIKDIRALEKLTIIDLYKGMFYILFNVIDAEVRRILQKYWEN